MMALLILLDRRPFLLLDMGMSIPLPGRGEQGRKSGCANHDASGCNHQATGAFIEDLHTY